MEHAKSRTHEAKQPAVNTLCGPFFPQLRPRMYVRVGTFKLPRSHATQPHPHPLAAFSFFCRSSSSCDRQTVVALPSTTTTTYAGCANEAKASNPQLDGWRSNARPSTPMAEQQHDRAKKVGGGEVEVFFLLAIVRVNFVPYHRVYGLETQTLLTLAPFTIAGEKKKFRLASSQIRASIGFLPAA